MQIILVRTRFGSKRTKIDLNVTPLHAARITWQLLPSLRQRKHRGGPRHPPGAMLDEKLRNSYRLFAILNATARKSKQRTPHFGDAGKPGKCTNAPATISNSQQQHGSPLLTGGL